MIVAAALFPLLALVGGAVDGEAVMFVEVVYEYEPLFAKAFVKSTTLTATAAFNVRQNRDLSQIYQRDPNQPDPVATCDKFDSPVTSAS